MKILFITSSFNGMAQRLWIELDRLNHHVQIHIHEGDEKKLEDKVASYKPELIIAPYLTRKIPASVYENYTCLIVHPGIPGDRGASSLDWAILEGRKEWGVTILEAVEKMDAGPVWAYKLFPMRFTSKAKIYRCEVTQAAASAVLESVEKFEKKNFKPIPLDYQNPLFQGKWNQKIRQSDLRFNWKDSTQEIVKKIHAADSSPGVLVELFEEEYFAYGAWKEEKLKGKPGEIIAQRNKAVCVGTGDGAVWITHLKKNVEQSIKLPATIALGEKATHISLNEISPFEQVPYHTWREIVFEQEGDIGYLYFDFYNGAMDSDQCNRLREAFIEAKKRAKLIVLAGGEDLWSNGIHLNVIENAENPAEESWRNIQAIDDLIEEIILSTDHYIISALRGNAGAGGVPFALAADKVMARKGIVLNPHTKNMGLYGSEYWTYLLPKRIGFEKAQRFTEDALPWGTEVAYEIGLIDFVGGECPEDFMKMVKKTAREVMALPYFDKLIKSKKFQRKKDERNKPLRKYREEELAKMYENFFHDNWGYHYKRHCFVHKIPVENSLSEKDLYRNRREIYRKRKWERFDYDK